MKCPNCKAPVEKGDRYCEECGCPLNQHSPQKKSNPIVIVSIAFFASICVCGLTIFLMSRAGNSEIDEEAAKQQDETAMDAPTVVVSEVSEVVSTATPTSIPTAIPTSISTVIPTSIPTVPQVNGGGAEYVIMDSSSRYLTDADVAGLSIQQLNYAKNEIYARHGRRFVSPELQNYFNSKSWYMGMYDPKDFDQNYGNVLNNYEKKNVEFLQDREYMLDSNGYQLDAY